MHKRYETQNGKVGFQQSIYFPAELREKLIRAKRKLEKDDLFSMNRVVLDLLELGLKSLDIK